MRDSRKANKSLKGAIGTAIEWMGVRCAAPACCLVLGLLGAHAVGFGQDPPSTFHHDAQRTGSQSAVGPIAPRLVWSYQTGASIDTSPVISRDGTIYLASTDKGLYALTASGQLKWKFAARESIFSTPTLAPDGSILLAVLPKGIVSSPAIAADGTVYVGCLDGKIYAMDGSTGELWWAFSTGAYFVLRSPSIDNFGRIFSVTAMVSSTLFPHGGARSGPILHNPTFRRRPRSLSVLVIRHCLPSCRSITDCDCDTDSDSDTDVSWLSSLSPVQDRNLKPMPTALVLLGRL